MKMDFIKISEDFFGKAVDLINWDYLSKNINNTDKDLFKYKLLKKYDISVWLKVKEKHTKKYRALIEVLSTYDIHNRAGIGDDSVWDLCAHVVGLGRKSYIDSCINPESLILRYHHHDYIENFGYWIPQDAKCNIPNSLDFIEKED